MITRLLEKAFDFLLGPIQPAPVPKPSPERLSEPSPDPKQIAAQLRALADRIDPILVPIFPTPEPPQGWNTVMDESGDSGGKIKRKGSDVDLGKTKENEILNRIFDVHPGEGEIYLNPDETIALMEAVRADKGAKGRP